MKVTVEQAFAKAMQSIHDIEAQTILDDVSANGRAARERHKATRYFERGKDGWRYYRGRDRLYCYSVHRNIAGFYLTWEEVEERGQFFRRRFRAHKVKRNAITMQRRLSLDSWR